MSRRPSKPLNFTEKRLFNLDEIEDSPKISQVQLSKAKIFSSREEYAKSLSKGIRYMEIGVAWGYSAKLFIEASAASEALLIDLYNQDLIKVIL
jgi:predicted O-methyltransferase YrrM